MQGECCLGSPPQVRGKHLGGAANCKSPRITPAGAGKTCNLNRPRIAFEDHPRRCGENTPTHSPHESAPGSPPQVRGKRIGALAGMEQNRITPAGAGKTCKRVRMFMVLEDHPRRCGENGGVSYIVLASIGSPPQVRGKPPDKRIRHQKGGITPAGAGKTSCLTEITKRLRDHPRRCGENRAEKKRKYRWTGSPPQVRGKRVERYNGKFTDRITPAGAGKTPPLLCRVCPYRDHPRRCGENLQTRRDPQSLQGSPPQVRGKL